MTAIRRPQAVRQPHISRQMDSRIVLGDYQPPSVDWLRALVWGVLMGWSLLVMGGLLYVLVLGLGAVLRGMGG